MKKSKEKECTIIAGVNGAGKTSLYHVINSCTDLGERINIDEIVKSQGDWKDTLLQIRSGRLAMDRINECIENGISFHEETTLPGSTIVKQIKKAKEAGFRVTLYFVGIDDVDLAIERVRRRVLMGGHGIDERFIRKRYQRLSENLRRILPMCDVALLYDNTVRFRQIAVIMDGKLADCDRDLPNWFIDVLDVIPA